MYILAVFLGALGCGVSITAGGEGSTPLAVLGGSMGGIALILARIAGERS